MANTRVKDAGFLHKHIEKLALGVGALILLAAFFLFVASNPFKIVINNREYASPEDAVKELENNNTMLERGLANQSPLPEKVIPKFDLEVDNMLTRGLSAPSLTALASSGLTDRDIRPIDIPPPRFALASPPPLTNIKTLVGTDVLDMELNRPAEAFFELVGEERDPMDITMFVASGDFDIWEWAKRLREPAADAKGDPIPRGIWTQRFGIAGVGLLRQEWDPHSQSWKHEEIVAALPNQPRLLSKADKLDQTMTPGQTVGYLRQMRETIARPEMPWIGGLVQAVPPGAEELDVDGGVNAFGIAGDLGKAEQQILDLEKNIELLEEQKRVWEERRRPNPNRPARPARPEGPDFDDGGGRPDAGPRENPYDRRIAQMRAKIERLQPIAEKEKVERTKKEEEARRREELRKARENLLGAAEDPALAAQEGVIMINGVQLQEGTKIRVWAADLTMKPGKTYRYKLLVSVINPLYAVPRLDPEQLEENKDRPALLPTEADIAKIPWSEPVTVEPRRRIFFVSGTEARGKVEVFQRVAGEMRKVGFDVAPGDVVGGMVSQEGELLDVNVNQIVVDLETRRGASGPTVVMILMDQETGKITERSLEVDSTSGDRKALNEEVNNETEWVFRPDTGDSADFEPGRFDVPFDEFGGP